MRQLEDLQLEAIDAYAALKDEVAGSLGPELKAAFVTRLEERFLHGYDYGWIFVGFGGLNSATDFALTHYYVKWLRQRQSLNHKGIYNTQPRN